MIEPRKVLVEQVTTLISDLTDEHRRVAKPRTDNTPDAVVFNALKTTLSRLLTDAAKLRDDLSIALDFQQACHQLTELRTAARDVFGESLAIELAPLIRARDVDRGMCRIADSLLKALSLAFVAPWPHFTILSDSEYFGTAAQLVRIVYPASQIWDLPIAAHEFGHFFGPQWKNAARQNPYAEFLERPELGGPAHAQELFADLFAVFALGPAYACTCLLRRFNPHQRKSLSHPGDITRAALVLNHLKRLALATTQKQHGPIHSVYELLKDYWTQTLTASQVVPPSGPAWAAMQLVTTNLWDELMHDHSNAAYLEIGPAFAVVADFRERRLANTVSARHRPQDALNGLWLIRLQAADERHEGMSTAVELETWGKTILTETTR